MPTNSLTSEPLPSESVNLNSARSKAISPAPDTAPRWLSRLLAPLSQVSEGLLHLQLPNGDSLHFGTDNGLSLIHI